MQTPSHAILNLALLLPGQPQMAVPIAIGAILPDVPMFGLYVWARLIRQQPEQQIWRETYWLPFWQTFNHTFHSIPLALGAIALTHVAGWLGWEVLFVSALLHSLGDLPVHHDDAHRHFLPFSHYRFMSPLSYWDCRHYGRWVSLVERLLVLGTTLYLFPQLESWVARGLFLLVNMASLSGYCFRWLARICGTATIAPPATTDLITTDLMTTDLMTTDLMTTDLMTTNPQAQ